MEIKYLENKTLNSNPLISIVIINYNGIKYLPELFKSLSEQTYKNFELIIWDNNSSDGSQQWLRQQKIIKKCTPIYNQSNIGFGKANNESIKFTKSELVCLLNYDTIVDKNWLLYLNEGFIKNNADIVGSKILFRYPYIDIQVISSSTLATKFLPFTNSPSNGPTIINNNNPEKYLKKNKYIISSGTTLQISVDNNQTNSIQLRWDELLTNNEINLAVNNVILEKNEYYWVIPNELIKSKFIINSLGLFTDPKSGKSRDIGIFKNDINNDLGELQIKALSGCCFMFRKSLFNNQKLFDPDYFMYYEDVDLFWRLRPQKLNIFLIKSSICYHHMTIMNSRKKLYINKSLKTFAWKNSFYKTFILEYLYQIKQILKCYINAN